MIQCERESKVVRWDEGTFTDCFDEIDADGPRREVEECAEAGDGRWTHDAAPSKWCHPAVKGSGRRVVSTRGEGSVVTFKSLDAATKRAAAVFADMQVCPRGLHRGAWLRLCASFTGCPLQLSMPDLCAAASSPPDVAAVCDEGVAPCVGGGGGKLFQR